ncbi:MAG TPA: AI-2E family transporter [Acidimicrobiia bacterium]|nr:AI-2E family transporter [Acidimicrobiia bacterium]
MRLGRRDSGPIPPAVDRLHMAGQISWDILRVLALAAVAIWLLYQVKLIVIPLMLGTFASSLGTPLVSRLDARGLPRLLSTWIVALGSGLTAFLLGWFLFAEIQGSADELASALADAWEELARWLESVPAFGGQSLLDAVEQTVQNVGGEENGLGRQVFSGFGSVTEAIAGMFLTAVTAFFIVKDGDRFWEWLLSKVPDGERPGIAAAGAAAWMTLRRYFYGTALVGVVNGTALAVTLLIIGAPLVIPLAILMFLGAFFPLIGAVVSGAVISLTVLATNGVTDALIVAVVVIIVQQLEGDLVAPVVLGRAVSLHPLIILFGITAGFVVGGIVGAFVTVPFIAITAQTIRTLRPEILQTE